MEVIDIEDDQAHRVVVTLVTGELPLQAALPVASVEQSGQSVAQRQLLHPRVLLPDLTVGVEGEVVARERFDRRRRQPRRRRCRRRLRQRSRCCSLCSPPAPPGAFTP